MIVYQNELVNGSEKLLSNAERYAKVVATSVNTSEDQSNQTRRTLSRTNIGIYNAVHVPIILKLKIYRAIRYYQQHSALPQ